MIKTNKEQTQNTTTLQQIDNTQYSIAPMYSMTQTIEIFLDAVTHVFKNNDNDNQTIILNFITEIIGNYNPYTMLTIDGLPAVVNLVFSNVAIRDFILSTQFTFFSRWLNGRSVELVNALIDSLAISVSCDCGFSLSKEKLLEKFIAMPEEIYDSFINYGNAVDTIKANPWVIVLLLLQSSINLDAFETSVKR